MLQILYEDQEILVVEKPAGMESQIQQKFCTGYGQRNKKTYQQIMPNRKRTVCGSYPQAGQAGRRRYGLCKDKKSGSYAE